MPDLDRLLHDVIEASLSPVDVGAIVARRRRRRRVRRVAVAAGAAVIVVAAAAVAVAGSRSTARRPVAAVHVSPGDPTAAQAATDSALAHSLLMAGGGGSGALGEALSSLTVVDPVTGTTHEVPLPLPPAQSSVYPYVVRGSSFVVVLDSQTGATDPAIGAAYAVPSTLRAAVPIGRASYAFAALDPDRVWLATDDATPQQRINGIEYGPHRGVEEVDLTGHASTPVLALTADRSPVAEVAGGLLTSRPDPVKANPPIIEVWDPAHDRVVRRLPAADVVAEGGSWVAYTQPDCSTACAMHVVDVRTGAARAYPPPAGTEWDGEGESLFSPDGTQLALVARAPDRDPHFGSSGRSTARAIVSTITTATGARHDGSVTISADRVALAWSPDSAVVFFTLDQGHVGYFPVPDAATPLRTLAIAGAPDFFVVGRTPPPPASTAAPEP